MRGCAVIALVTLVTATIACKRESTPPNTGEVVGVSGSAAATTTATAAAPGGGDTAAGGATGDPFAQARNANPTAAAGAMNDPFAAARLVQVAKLPATLPRDPHGVTPLKIEPMTFAFAGPFATLHATGELKPSGLLLLDSKRSGSVGGSKAAITSGKHPVSVSLRSDGYAVYGGYATLKKVFMHRDADGLTTSDGNRLSVSPDGLAIVNTGAAGEILYARVSPPITDERGKTTALMIMAAMYGHGVEVSENGGVTVDVSQALPPPPRPPGGF